MCTLLRSMTSTSRFGDSQGNYRSFKITESLKVVKHDPYAMHVRCSINIRTKHSRHRCVSGEA